MDRALMFARSFVLLFFEFGVANKYFAKLTPIFRLYSNQFKYFVDNRIDIP